MAKAVEEMDKPDCKLHWQIAPDDLAHNLGRSTNAPFALLDKSHAYHLQTYKPIETPRLM